MNHQTSPKERLLSTASRLFYVQGYNATGVNQILKESNVARASMYQHFGSKDELGLQYLKKIREDWFDSFEAYLLPKTTEKAKLLAAFDFLEQGMVLNEFRGCRFLNILSEIDTHNHKMQQEIVEHKTKLRELFKELVKNHFTKQGIPFSPNCSDIIYFLFEAAITESKVYKDKWPILTAKEGVSKILK